MASPCDAFFEKLSADLDGVLPSDERRRCQAHLASCPSCTGLRESLQAAGDVLRLGMNRRLSVDGVDWKAMTERVMAQLPAPTARPVARKPSFFSHLWQTQRLGLLTSALAAALVVVLVPRLIVNAVDPGTVVQSVRVDPAAHVSPMVASDSGDTIIWLVDHDDHLSVADERAMPAWSDHPPLPVPGANAATGKRMNPQEPSGGDL